MTKTYRILSCPFCGGIGNLVERSGGWTVNCYNSDVINSMVSGKYCSMDDVSTIFCLLPEKAIKIWNTRAEESYTTVAL